MKKSKLFLAVFFGIALVACKKHDISSDQKTENLELSKKSTNDTSLDVIEGGLCIDNFITNMFTFINTWGIGSNNWENRDQNIYFETDRWQAHNAVYSAFNNCRNGVAPGGGAYDPAIREKQPFIYLMPPSGLEDWLTFLNLDDLCDVNKVNEARAFIVPLNAIIKRTVDDIGGSYYGLTSEDRFRMIVMHMYVGESVYLDVSHAAGSNHRAFLYLKAASYLFHIPNVIANKLFDKPLAPVDPVEGGSPTPITLEPWDGFIVDHTPAKNIFNNYCATPPPPPAPILLPNPLPNGSIMYYLSVEDAQNTIADKSLDTSIFLNVSNSKYYINSSFTSTVPDGYYKHPSDYSNNNYYHIVNGLVTGIVQIVI